MPYRNSLKLLIVLLFPLQLFAQEPDITGLWRGFMFNDTTQKNYRYEIAISEEKGKLYGYSHTYFILDDKEYHGVKKLKIKRDGNEITTEDVDLIANNYPVKPPKLIHMQNVLIFTMKDTVMVLSGMFRTNRTRDFSPNTGYVHVERKRDYNQSALIPHLQELGLAKNLTFLKEENVSAAEQPIVMLKPMLTEEEEKLIVSNAKKQSIGNTIKTTTAPAVTMPPVAETIIPPAEIAVAVPPATKPVDAPVVKTITPKPEPVVVNKPAAVVTAPATKPAEQPVVKTVTPKPESVAVNKPAAKPAEQPVVKPTPVPVKTNPPVVTAPAPKPVEQAVVKAAPANIAVPVLPKPAPVNVPVIADPTAATDLNKRKIENIQALYFKSDSLQLTLYDNGEVDGDTVSVVMNGQVIMPKVGLTTNAVRKTIYTQDAGDSIQLIMYAESLGSLPPNTGLLIVYDGADRYEIRFSGDMQKSSAIVFRRKKN
jgi:hypothetical protein